MQGNETANEVMFSKITLILLTVLSVALYWPLGSYDFIALDDNLYVVENVNLQRGFSVENLAWAMTTFHTTNWHPLTWISYMIDYELFNLNPAGYHIHNMILHIFNTLLLFLLMRQLTGKFWRSAIVAALFAVHPMNIESVVWIAERKNLLSTLFMIMATMAYVRYVRCRERRSYFLMLVCFILGLMAKPLLVMLPFVFLLLDYWPLQRVALTGPDKSKDILERSVRRKFLSRLIMEKVPLFLLALLSAGMTVLAASSGGALKAISDFPISGRIENAIISYVTYLYKMAWPTDLAIFYPYPATRPLWKIELSILFLISVTAFVFITGRKHRYLITGWLWYGITLLPVIGLIQVGFQSMANRYVYVPMIGILMVIVWGVPDLLKSFSGRRYLPVVAILVVVVFAFTTKAFLPKWKNSVAVFQHALNITKDNHIAEAGMGGVFLGQGNLRKAKSHYQEALRIKPDYAAAHNNLGMILALEGKVDDAEAQYHMAINDDPVFEKAYNNLGVLLAIKGEMADAKAYFQRALELNPRYAEAKGNLDSLLREEAGIPKVAHPEP